MMTRLFLGFVLASLFPFQLAVASDEISGVHEVVFGVSDLDEAEQYWTRFGYHKVDEGTLSEEEAMALYHVPSSAKVLRMAHMDTDHNYVRLWEWEHETGPGAGIVPCPRKRKLRSVVASAMLRSRPSSFASQDFSQRGASSPRKR